MPEAQLVIHEDAQVTPFWNRLPRFFLFPLQLEMLFVIVPLALASLLARLLPVPTPLDYVLGEGLIWLAAFRHAFDVMERTSQGLLTAEAQAGHETDRERRNLPWKMFGVFLAWGLIIGGVATLSRALGIAANILFTLSFPASVMALSVTNSFSQAIDPVLWASIMRRIGKAYLVLFIFLLLLSGGFAAALPLLAPFLRGWLALPLVNFVFLYFNLIMFNMMGYVLYQYHQVLGLEVKVDFARAEGRKAVPAKPDPVADQVAAKIAQGDTAGALEIAYEQQRMEPENLAAQDRYHKLLLATGNKERALEHGGRYLSTLLRLGRDDGAFDLLKRLRALDEAFQPEKPDQVLRLAETAYRRRESALALSLVRGFDKRHPRHPDVPGIYLLSARVLCEHYHKDDLAGAILRAMRQKYPDHPLAAEAEAYLKVIDNLRVKPA